MEFQYNIKMQIFKNEKPRPKSLNLVLKCALRQKK